MAGWNISVGTETRYGLGRFGVLATEGAKLSAPPPIQASQSSVQWISRWCTATEVWRWPPTPILRRGSVKSIAVPYFPLCAFMPCYRMTLNLYNNNKNSPGFRFKWLFSLRTRRRKINGQIGSYVAGADSFWDALWMWMWLWRKKLHRRFLVCGPQPPSL